MPLIGWAKPVPVNLSNFRSIRERDFALIAAAGPASNLVMAVRGAAALQLARGSAVRATCRRPLTSIVAAVFFIRDRTCCWPSST